MIAYLPVLYQAFSRREVQIALLDARAGSPPAAGELLRRHGYGGNGGANVEVFGGLLKEYERWCAELLESYIKLYLVSDLVVLSLAA